MKSLITLCLSLFVCFGITHAQTTLYSQNFNSGSASEWSLNTTDMGGVATPNYWIINNDFAGDPPLITNTPDEPAGISGSPESYYMHITSAFGAGLGAQNCTYNASGSHSYFAAMQTPFSTTGYSNVNIAFWWICKGNAHAFGQIYYRTSASGAWTQISTMSVPAAALDSYNTQNTWQQVTGIHVDAFDNQAFLEFGFRFQHQASGNDPAFGVDDIAVVGTPSVVSPPATSFSATATSTCQDSCIMFTSTTTGTVDSVRWTAPGATISSPTSDTTTICFPASGAITVHLYAYNSGGEDSSSTVINVTPTPMPVVIHSGHTLSVPGVYTSYQWYNGAAAITGATTSTYTYSVSGVYSVLVDSAGCPGTSTVFNTTGIANISAINNIFWVFQQSQSSVSVNSSIPLSDELAVTIYDATGRKLLDEAWNAGSFTKQINGLSIPSGLYIIKLSNSYTSSVLKWLKQ